VQRGHAGVGQRRGVDGIDVAERHEVAGRDDDVVGHAAVARDADRTGGDVPADVVSPARARLAPTAAEQLVDGHDGRPLQCRHALAERRDLAHDLVAERDRQREPGAAPVQQVDVRPADAGRQHPKQGLARSRLGARQVDDLRAARAHQSVGAHTFPSEATRRRPRRRVAPRRPQRRG